MLAVRSLLGLPVLFGRWRFGTSCATRVFATGAHKVGAHISCNLVFRAVREVNLFA